MRLLRYLPKNHLSWLFGAVINLPLPRPLARLSISVFCKIFAIDASLSSRPISDFRSIGEFFIRDLRPGLRPIPANSANLVLSPCDGKLRNRGDIVGGRIEQVKGKTYSVAEFLANHDMAGNFQGGSYFNLYLAPPDYHHVHFPVSGRIVRRTHIPGKLWPVNDWSINTVDDLFSVNERVVTYIETESFGLVAAVMVGATNVGKISLSYDVLVTNSFGSLWQTKQTKDRAFDPPLNAEAGERLGTFRMGSTVVVLLEKPLKDYLVSPGTTVRYGDVLAKLT